MSHRILTLPERLIVAADFNLPDDEELGWVRDQVLKLADELQGTGVYFKVNSALRASGYSLINEIHSRGLRVFADLKLYDIGDTLAIDGKLIRRCSPELLTVACCIGKKSLTALKKELPDVEVLGVTILTDLAPQDVQVIHGGLTLSAAAENLTELAMESGLDGLICSAAEATRLRQMVGEKMTINTPAIRPVWANVPGDGQNPHRIMTPLKAMQAGADRIVVGRPILNAPYRYDAVMRTLDEIALAF